ncbi:MAG: PhzF family phenazine biosynthesis protein, partial [Acidobacteria bacterium]|nr:PhzF family phenazine biosynthesis protein [Acidobacteriota bacterium]
MSDPLRVAAFTSDPAGGNMAGVVIGDHGTPSEMMAVAAEVGYSETAFLEPTDDRMVWNTRYFAPQMEVDFCGHATIAAGSILGTRFGAGTYLLRTNVGEISVERTLGDDGDVRVTLTSVAPAGATGRTRRFPQPCRRSVAVRPTLIRRFRPRYR